ncbi:MAG: CRISPR-associated endonuclease Cas3'' [Bdellovibrionales bacterium]|nr:CRISPR-associated endonuclease Cas3'' [Bdellovibrionales bacterium]
MIKKVSDNELLANTKGQTLKEHSIAVALYGYLLLKSLKFKGDIEKKINECLIYSALFHDIGKVSSSFQDYIKKATNNNLEDMPMDAEASRPKKFKGPFHNEISWAYSANFIDFNNHSIRDAVRHSIYWHHPANWSDEDNKLLFENSQILFEKVKEKLKENVPKLLCDIHKFVGDLLNVFYADYFEGFERLVCLKKPNENNIEAIQYPYFFSHKIDRVACNAKKQLCLNLLLEADRKVSSWEVEELTGFLNKWKSYKIPIHKTDKFSIEENLEENKKSKEQYNLANEMADKKLSVCGVDPAGGKTSVSLYWWHKCNNEYPLMIALPRQNQVTGLFKPLESDCERVYGTKINMEAVFNGQRQHCNWKPKDIHDLLISNINILVFDRFLSPYYKRKQSSEFLKMLKSHLILDEFHEFNALPKMIPSLKEILTIRSWLESGVKTLMLSGTPEPSLLKLLCIEDKSVFKREKLSPRNEHKFKIAIKEASLEEKQKFYPDCLYSFLRVDSCQNVFSQFFKTIKDKIKMIHSYFTVSDKKKLLKGILQEHGKGQKTVNSDNSVITSKMLQSSYNLSFKKAVVELSQPYMDCQTAGRINRFENKPNAKIHFFYNEDSEKFFNESRGAGFKEIHKSWKKHILSFIEDHKDQTVSIRELMKSYDNFWNEENIQKSLTVLKNKQVKAIEELNKYMPKRFFSGRKAKISSLNSLFRGDSQYLSACVVNNEGEPIDQLHDENLLSESRDLFITQIKSTLQICLKSKDKCKKANKINEEEVFEYNKHIKNFGFKTERPLLCSHVNSEIDKCLSTNFKDEDNNLTVHRVYHKKFGLVKKDLLKNE